MQFLLAAADGTIWNARRYRVAAPSIRIVPWAALASCWPLPQQLLPVSAAGGGRRRCTLRIFSGKNILNFAFVALCGALQTHFHGRGRNGKRHLQRRFLRKRGAAGERLLPLGGAVAQRLRGFESAEPEKTVKRSSRRTGVNLQFFPVQPTSLGLKGASSPFFVAPARRNRWWFSGSLLPPKENIPRLPPPTPQRCNCRFFSTLSVKNTLCKKLTGKLRRTSRLTDTKVFFITAKDPARGSTPRCGGTSAPRREP